MHDFNMQTSPSNQSKLNIKTVVVLKDYKSDS